MKSRPFNVYIGSIPQSDNESQRDALFLKFTLRTLYVSDNSTVHQQEYLNTVYTR